MLRCVEQKVRTRNEGRQTDQPALDTAPGPVLVSPVQETTIERPTGLRRTVSFLQIVLPVVQDVLSLFERKNVVAVTSLAIPQPAALAASPAPAADPAPVQNELVDLAPIKDKLAEFKFEYRELRDRVAEQSVSLNRIEDRLESVREATDRNTREQQELIGELRGVGKRVYFMALVALGLVTASVGIEFLLCLRLFNIIR